MSETEIFLAAIERSPVDTVAARKRELALLAALRTARKRFLFLALDVDRGKAKGPADALVAKFDARVAKALKGEV